MEKVWYKIARIEEIHNLTLGHLYRVIVRFFMNHFFLQTVIGKITFNFFILFACCLIHQRHLRSFGIPLAIMCRQCQRHRVQICCQSPYFQTFK